MVFNETRSSQTKQASIAPYLSRLKPRPSVDHYPIVMISMRNSYLRVVISIATKNRLCEAGRALSGDTYDLVIACSAQSLNVPMTTAYASHGNAGMMNVTLALSFDGINVSVSSTGGELLAEN